MKDLDLKTILKKNKIDPVAFEEELKHRRQLRIVGGRRGYNLIHPFGGETIKVGSSEDSRIVKLSAFD